MGDPLGGTGLGLSGKIPFRRLPPKDTKRASLMKPIGHFFYFRSESNANTVVKARGNFISPTLHSLDIQRYTHYSIFRSTYFYLIHYYIINRLIAGHPAPPTERRLGLAGLLSTYFSATQSLAVACVVHSTAPKLIQCKCGSEKLFFEVTSMPMDEI